MTNCIKQITSCTIKNKSQCRSCGIIEIIPPKHFTHVSPTDVHTCSAHITLQECSYKQQETAGEVNTQRGSSISLCLILTIPHAFSWGFFGHEEGKAEQAVTQDMLLSLQLFQRCPWGAVPNIHIEHYCPGQITCHVQARRLMEDSHYPFSLVTEPCPPKAHKIIIPYCIQGSDTVPVFAIIKNHLPPPA